MGRESIKNQLRKRKMTISTYCLVLFSIFIFLFLALPIMIIMLSAFSPTEYPSFPPKGFSLRWFHALFQDSNWMVAMSNSVKMIVVSVPVSLLLGTLAAYGLANLHFTGKSALQSFAVSPLMMPEIVLGIALLYLSTALGLFGTFIPLMIGHILVSFPYVFRTVTSSLSTINHDLKKASMNLGATQWQTFIKIILPNIRPGIITGAIFAAITSLGEVSISLLVSSANTKTIPVQTMNYIEQTYDPSVNAVAVLFIFIAIISMIILDKMINIRKI